MENKKRIQFSFSESGELARFIAELERGKVSYEIETLKYGWIVVIRGVK